MLVGTAAAGQHNMGLIEDKVFDQSGRVLTAAEDGQNKGPTPPPPGKVQDAPQIDHAATLTVTMCSGLRQCRSKRFQGTLALGEVTLLTQPSRRSVIATMPRTMAHARLTTRPAHYPPDPVTMTSIGRVGQVERLGVRISSGRDDQPLPSSQNRG